MQLILASNSPRRKDILTEFGYDFSVIKSDYSESDIIGKPVETAVNNAIGKAKDVFNGLTDKNAVVIGADTIVVYNDKIIGKPKDEKDAFNTLKMLSDNTHMVYTGYAIVTKDKVISGFDTSLVTFKLLTDDFIKEYIATGKPMDKAGSYGLQDGIDIAKSYQGSFYNIIGLPIEKIKPYIDEFLGRK